MRLLDLNLLVYAMDESSVRHERARSWLDRTLTGTDTVALSWSVLIGFLRLSTRPVVFANPLTVEEALDVIEGWLAQPCVTVVHPTDRHLAVLREIITPLGTAGSDAHLAAPAIEHGAELCSTDTDLARFTRVRWIDPLR